MKAYINPTKTLKNISVFQYTIDDCPKTAPLDDLHFKVKNRRKTVADAAKTNGWKCCCVLGINDQSTVIGSLMVSELELRNKTCRAGNERIRRNKKITNRIAPI